MKTLFLLFSLIASSVFAGEVEYFGTFSLYRVNSTLVMKSEDMQRVLIIEGNSFKTIKTSPDVLGYGYPALKFILSDKDSLLILKKMNFSDHSFLSVRVDTLRVYLKRSGDEIFTKDVLTKGGRDTNIEFLLLLAIGLMIVLLYFVRAYYYGVSFDNYSLAIAVLAFLEMFRSVVLASAFLLTMMLLAFLVHKLFLKGSKFLS